MTRDVNGSAPDSTTMSRPTAIWEKPRERAKYSWTTDGGGVSFCELMDKSSSVNLESHHSLEYVSHD